MGMSASQARLLSLEARQSNLEYQGQQINQERSILSQQSTALYNSLLAMTVPTPPSTSDYSVIEYAGADGASNFKLGNIKPNNNNTYTVEMKYQKVGHYVDNAGTVLVSNTPDDKLKTEVQERDPEIAEPSKPEIPVEDENVDKSEALDQNPEEIAEEGEAATRASGEIETENEKEAALPEEAKADPIKKYTSASPLGKYIAGNPVIELDQAKEMLGNSYDTYVKSLRNNFTEYTNLNDEEFIKMFSVYTTKTEGSSTLVPHFVLTEELNRGTDANGNSYIDIYDYMANGTYTATEEKKDCLLTFDSSGRITEIKIPIYDKDTEKIATYKTVSLEATKVTDNNAYQDAYAKYEYEQYLYDKKQQEINKKTEIIQQEDRNLELKLQRLDNERSQITTEIEAVQNVIKNNIEKTYKTFSG